MVPLAAAPAPIDFGHLIGASERVLDSGRSYVRGEPVKRDLLGLELFRVNLVQTAGIMTIDGQPVPVRFKHFAYEGGAGTLDDRPLAVYQRVSLNPFSRKTYRIAPDLDGRGIENHNGYVLTDVAEARIRFPYSGANLYRFLTDPNGQLSTPTYWQRVKSSRKSKTILSRDATSLSREVNYKYVGATGRDSPAYLHASDIKAIDMKLIKGFGIGVPGSPERLEGNKIAPDLIVLEPVRSSQINKLSGTVYSTADLGNGPVSTDRNWQAALTPFSPASPPQT